MSAIQKYSESFKGIEFCDDFGEGPLLLGHITTDRSIIAVASLLGGFIAMAGLGFPGALFVAFAALNDCSYAGKVSEPEDETSSPSVDKPAVDGAIDIQAETVGDHSSDANKMVAAAPSMQHIVSPVWNPAQDLGENPQSALIVGTPGSGKGMMVSNAIRVLKARSPELKVFVIDPKADKKERGYWESIADVYCAFSLMNCLDPDEGASWLLQCMDRFQSIEGPKLCIFDELMTASTELGLANKELKALAKLKKFVVGIIGQGDSQNTWLWCMTQSPQVQDLGMGGGVRANLRVVALVSPKNITAVEAIVSTKLIPSPAGGMDELRAIMKASPVDRAVFDGKIARWLPMPKLENHSGYDRDNRSSTAPEKPTGNLEDVFLVEDEPWETAQPIEDRGASFESTAIGSDDEPNLADLIDQVGTIAATSTGEARKTAKTAAFSAANELQSGNPEKAIEICKSFLNEEKRMSIKGAPFSNHQSLGSRVKLIDQRLKRLVFTHECFENMRLELTLVATEQGWFEAVSVSTRHDGACRVCICHDKKIGVWNMTGFSFPENATITTKHWSDPYSSRNYRSPWILESESILTTQPTTQAV